MAIPGMVARRRGHLAGVSSLAGYRGMPGAATYCASKFAIEGLTKSLAQELPAGMAYAEGKEIYFVHTEASDAGVAETLTNMMKSPVVLVPSLANVPDDSLANVYVFTNGLAGSGPFGFQADVFDNPPGTDGYTPLRRLNVIAWVDETKARELTHVDDVLAAEAAGEAEIRGSKGRHDLLCVARK